MVRSILYISISCLLIQNCDFISNCETKCKNKTREYLIQNQIFNTTATNSLTAGASTGRTFTKSEQESNDTFLQSFNNFDNSISVINPDRNLVDASISSSGDIDIFDITLNNNTNILSVTQENSLSQVDCIIYEKLDSFTKLRTNVSTPDSSYTNKGKLNSNYTLSKLGQAYIIFSGTSGVSYRLKVEGLDSGITGNSPANVANFFNNFTITNVFANCLNATANCEKQCNKSNGI
jgi:hypothetical protein